MRVINCNTARQRRTRHGSCRRFPALGCLQALVRQTTIFLSDDEASSIDFSRWDVKAVGRAGDWDNDEDVGEQADCYRWIRRQDNGPTCPAFGPVVSEGRDIPAGSDSVAPYDRRNVDGNLRQRLLRNDDGGSIPFGRNPIQSRNYHDPMKLGHVALGRNWPENVDPVGNRRPVRSVPNRRVVVDDCRRKEQPSVLQSVGRPARVDATAGNSATSEKWAAFLVSIGSIPYRLDWMSNHFVNPVNNLLQAKNPQDPDSCGKDSEMSLYPL